MESTSAPKMETQPAALPAFQRPSGSGGGNKKGTSAERRATHNAIERARRESLNGRFLQLASSLPSISDVRRPSKSLIVNKSLDFVADALNREAMYRHKIDSMRQENTQLRQQLNKFLAQAGLEQLAQPPVDELPVPMAEMRNKKRQSGMTGPGSLADMYDLDDDDGPLAPGSEGEGGKTSPTSSCSAASSLRGSLSSSQPAGVAGFTPLSHGGVYGPTASSFLATPAAMLSVNGTSPGASSSSDDVGARERSAGFEDGSGNWTHADAFNARTLPNGAGVSQASAAPQLTYAGLAFSSSGVSSGLAAPAPSARSLGNGLPHFTTANGSAGLDDTGAGATGAGLSAVLGQDGQSHMYSMNAGNFINLRNAQMQQQQQQQLQFQLQLQQHQHQQQQQQQQQQQHAAGFVHFNPSSSFFEQAPLQSASFMTAV